MPVPDKSTVEALQRLSWAKTHRAKCVALSLPMSWRGTVGRILYGHSIGLDKENEVRLRLGLPLLAPPMIEVPPCPDCGKAHTGRCNGKPVVEIVALAPGEVVKPAPKARQRKAYWRPCLSVELGTALAEAGIDAEAALWSAVERSRHDSQN